MSYTWLRWNDWPLAAKGVTVIALPVALLLVSLASNYRLQQEITEAENEVHVTQHIQAGIQALHTLIAEAATGVRGYLLTGRDDFLTPYWTADAQLPKTLAELQQDVRDPEQRRRLAHAASLVATKLASLDTLRTQGRYLSSTDLQDHLLASKKVLDELRAEIQAMLTREAELLAQRTANVSAVLQRNLLMNVAAALLALAGGIGAMLLYSGGIVRRVKRVAANADRLVNGTPLLPMPVARDELGQLADRLQNASLLLAARATEAQAASRAKTDFLSRTSHELRTPLNAILGFAQLLEADLNQTPAASKVTHILDAGRHLLQLIDEVLDIARIESGDLKLARVPVPLERLLAEACALVAPQAAQHGIQLQANPVAADCAVLADRQRLLQVLLNLLSNAIKYNRPGGWVRLNVFTPPERVLIEVHDSGVGIAAPLLPRLFTPFDRLDAALNGTEGTGLGLTVSKQLIESMGGSIEVESREGVGSVFALSLALAEPALPKRAAAASPITAAPALAGTQRSLRVLCIEDNASNLALIEALLERRPHWQMSSAQNGREGLQCARERTPDLILLDLHLPDTTGDAILAELRSDASFKNTPIAIVSADALPATIERLLAAGASDYLTKPLEVPRFLALLDRVQP